jgi:16S rRNA (guanine(966)-N(2))-methyltransferase RsmD
MRVIAGEFRSRRLKSPPGFATRPTADRLRETLFDVLASRVEGTVFVDAYAGSGAVGIEALSRGAARAVFLEKNKAAARVILENLNSLGLRGRFDLVTGPSLSSLRKFDADIVFLDPPYDDPDEYKAALGLLGDAPPPLAIAQHDRRLALAERYGRLHRTRVLKRGDHVLSFFSPLIASE